MHLGEHQEHRAPLLRCEARSNNQERGRYNCLFLFFLRQPAVGARRLETSSPKLALLGLEIEVAEGRGQAGEDDEVKPRAQGWRPGDEESIERHKRA